MPVLKRFFNFYIFGNIHVALAVFCLVKITLIFYEINSNLVAWFCFFSTIASYNLIRIFRIDELQPWFFAFIRYYKLTIILLTVFSAFIAFSLIFYFRYQTVLWLLPFVLVTFFYVNPFSVKNKKRSLRNIGLIKLFLVAISWAGVTVIIPLVQHRIGIGFEEVIIFLQRFLFVMAITIPFDIRDATYDNERLKTLPQAIGVQKSKWLGLVFLIIFVVLEILKEPSPEQLGIHFLIAVFTLFFLVKATEKQNEYYSSFFVESLPMVWLLLVILIG